MSSKLEPHADLILGLLLNGSTYKKVVEALHKDGCKTNLANVHAWVNRRSKKLVARAHLVNPRVDYLAPVASQVASAGISESTSANSASPALKHKANLATAITSPNTSQTDVVDFDSRAIAMPTPNDRRQAGIHGKVQSETGKFLDDLIANQDAKQKPNLVFTKKMKELLTASNPKDV